MRDFKDRRRDSRSSGRGFGRRDNRDKEMFETVCDDCGKKCQVPFKPSTDKPVYCSECFEKRGGGNESRNRDDRGSRRFDSRKSDFRERENFSLSSREDKSGKDFYSKDSSNDFSSLTTQVKLLNEKLDKIIALIQPKAVRLEKVEIKKETPVKTSENTTRAKVKEVKKTSPKKKKTTKK